MPIVAEAFRTAIVCFSTLLPNCVQAEGIDTEHLFGFMIGTDIGSPGEREFQSQTTGRFSKSGGRYPAVGQEFELEFVPANDFLIQIRSAFAAPAINSVPDFRDRPPLAWPRVSVDLPYRFFDPD